MHHEPALAVLGCLGCGELVACFARSIAESTVLGCRAGRSAKLLDVHHRELRQAPSAWCRDVARAA